MPSRYNSALSEIVSYAIDGLNQRHQAREPTIPLSFPTD